MYTVYYPVYVPIVQPVMTENQVSLNNASQNHLDQTFFQYVVKNWNQAQPWLYENAFFNLSPHEIKDVLAAFLFQEYLDSSQRPDIKILHSLARAVLTQINDGVNITVTPHGLELLPDELSLNRFWSFIRNVKNKMSQDRFKAKLDLFRKAVLDVFEITFKTLKKIEGNFSLDEYGQHPTGYKFEYLKAKITAFASVLLKQVKGAPRFLESETFIARLDKREKCLSIISTLCSASIGSGLTAAVYNARCLTKREHVAIKTNINPSSNLRSWNTQIRVEFGITRMFRSWKTKQCELLPGLLFFPFQESLGFYQTSQGALCLISTARQMNLRAYLKKNNPPIVLKFEIILQAIYTGAFCEKLKYFNMDAGMHNFLIDIKTDGHPRIYLIDYSMITAENYEKLPIHAKNILKDEKGRIFKEKNEKLWEKTAVYLYGFLAFKVFAQMNPFEQSGQAVVFSEKSENAFRKAFQDSRVAASTVDELLKQLKLMIEIDPFKRCSCEESFKKIQEIIASDSFLAGNFRQLHDYTGPWETKMKDVDKDSVPTMNKPQNQGQQFLVTTEAFKKELNDQKDPSPS